MKKLLPTFTHQEAKVFLSCRHTESFGQTSSAPSSRVQVWGQAPLGGTELWTELKRPRTQPPSHHPASLSSPAWHRADLPHLPQGHSQQDHRWRNLSTHTNLKPSQTPSRQGVVPLAWDTASGAKSMRHAFRDSSKTANTEKGQNHDFPTNTEWWNMSKIVFSSLINEGTSKMIQLISDNTGCMAAASCTRASEREQAGAQSSTCMGSFWHLTWDTWWPHFHHELPGLFRTEAGVWDADICLLCAGVHLQASRTDPTAHSPTPLLGPHSISKAWEPLVFNPGCTHWHQQRGSKMSWLDKSSHVVISPTNPLKHPSK